jgi:phosphoribosylanthranilate isomerase
MVQIKICGLTNQADYDLVSSLGADYAGFIFYPFSPRYLNPLQKPLLPSPAIPRQPARVGVFVNETRPVIHRIYQDWQLDLVQLHGHESDQFCRELALPCWKAIRIKDQHSLSELDHFDCQVFLLDTFHKNLYGGSGQSFDLSLAQTAISTGKQIIIAGGISSENIADIYALHPFGIDLNSSLESSPGKKDPKKLRELFSKINQLRMTHGNQ